MYTATTQVSGGNYDVVILCFFRILPIYISVYELNTFSAKFNLLLYYFGNKSGNTDDLAFSVSSRERIRTICLTLLNPVTIQLLLTVFNTKKIPGTLQSRRTIRLFWTRRCLGVCLFVLVCSVSPYSDSAIMPTHLRRHFGTIIHLANLLYNFLWHSLFVLLIRPFKLFMC